MRSFHSIILIATAFAATLLMSAPAYAQGSHPIARKSVGSGQSFTANYDESKVKSFTTYPHGTCGH